MPTITFSSSSESATKQYVFASSQYYEIAAVYFDTGSGLQLKTEGVHWEYVVPFKHIIEILAPLNEVQIADGLSPSYTFITENGIANVFVDGELLASGADYLISGNTVNFVQPP